VIYIVAVLILSFLAVSAQVPATIPIQGQLFQKNGLPMPDGSYEAIVVLYESETGGTGLEICAPCTFTMSDGVFQIVLGGPGQPPLPRFDKPYWVDLTVNGERLEPRIALHSVPYAHEAAHVVQQKQGALPVGAIVPGAGVLSSALGYMVADGRPLSSTDYPELFSVLGRRWGDGSDDTDDATDFNLPDLRGVGLVGDDMGTGRDPNVQSREFKVRPESDSSTLGSYFAISEYPIYRSPRITPKSVVRGPQTGVVAGDEDDLTATTRSAPNAAVRWYIRVR
jgi:hypothetical protein